MLVKYRLFTPGPTSVPEATLLEMAKPVRHHRTAEFRAIFAEVQELLRYVYQTRCAVHTITGSGTAAAEAGIVSALAPGQKALVVSNGKFAERWATVCKTYGIQTKEIKCEYGRHAAPEQIDAELKNSPFDAVILVHSETSTGTVCDLQAIGQVVRRSGPTLLIVDGITSIGALPFKMDDWGVDVGITGSQKALMLPPGLAFVALSERAWAAVDANTSRQDFYLDLRKYRKSLADGDTPFTCANTLIEGLAVSLRMIRYETLEVVWKRTHGVAEAFRQGMRALGLELFSQQPADSVTSVRYPAGVLDKAFRGALKSQHNLHVAGGQGTMEGQIFRVNHMGYTDAYDALAAVGAIEHVLQSLGRPVDLGAGLSAAQKTLAQLFAADKT